VLDVHDAGVDFGLGNEFKNNIIYSDAGAIWVNSEAHEDITDDVPPKVTFANNSYLGVGATPFYDGADNLTFANWVISTGETNSIEADPSFTNAAGGDFTLTAESPCISAGVNLGASYDDALDPNSSWPDNVNTRDQDDNPPWEIGAYFFPALFSLSGAQTLSLSGAQTLSFY